jgi:hypothetical protein
VLDCSVGHHIVNDLAEDPMLAVVETDDSGGVGDQAAVVYRGDRVVMAPEVASRGPINAALRALGVHCVAGRDELDTVGLGKYRDFDDLCTASVTGPPSGK